MEINRYLNAAFRSNPGNEFNCIYQAFKLEKELKMRELKMREENENGNTRFEDNDEKMEDEDGDDRKAYVSALCSDAEEQSNNLMILSLNHRMNVRWLMKLEDPDTRLLISDSVCPLANEIWNKLSEQQTHRFNYDGFTDFFVDKKTSRNYKDTPKKGKNESSSVESEKNTPLVDDSHPENTNPLVRTGDIDDGATANSNTVEVDGDQSSHRQDDELDSDKGDDAFYMPYRDFIPEDLRAGDVIETYEPNGFWGR